MSSPTAVSSSSSILRVEPPTGWSGNATESEMKKTFLVFVPVFLAIAAVPAGYDHWTAEQFGTREKALHKAMKDGLASETLGSCGNHLLLKTRREASSGRAELHEKQADLIIVQSGRATIIVGGKILNGQTTAPN